MSRQNQISASLYIAYALGIRQQAYKLEKKVGMSTTELLEWVKPHAMKLVAMNELAEETAMSKPVKLEENLYGFFGKWIGDYINGNNKLPEDSDITDTMVNVVMIVYGDTLNSSQDGSLLRKLKEL